MIGTLDALSPVRAWSLAANRSETVRLPAAAVIKTMKKTTDSFFTRWLGPGVGVGVREGSAETVSQGLQERDQLVFLAVRQHEVADGHILRPRHFRHRPAIHFFPGAFRTVTYRHRERVFVARVVEMN